MTLNEYSMLYESAEDYGASDVSVQSKAPGRTSLSGAVWFGCLVGWGCLAHGCSSAPTTQGGSPNAADCGSPTYEAAAPSTHADGSSCMIMASNYDQSCRVDADCTLIAQGNYCTAGCLCQGAAINVGALLQFDVDVSMTPVATDAMARPANCMCLAPGGPCCRGGTCQVGARCQVSGSCN